MITVGDFLKSFVKYANLIFSLQTGNDSKKVGIAKNSFEGCPCEEEVYSNLPEDKIC